MVNISVSIKKMLHLVGFRLPRINSIDNDEGDGMMMINDNCTNNVDNGYDDINEDENKEDNGDDITQLIKIVLIMMVVITMINDNDQGDNNNVIAIMINIAMIRAVLKI